MLYYVSTDTLGTPHAATDSTGSLIWSYYHFPYGYEDGFGSSITQNLRFPGMYADDDPDGFKYNLQRDYYDATGRYLEADPIGLAGGLNPYRYANDNPLKFTDRLGLDGLEIIHGVPEGSVPYTFGDGSQFYAPPQADFCAELDTGLQNGSNPLSIDQSIGQFGRFDFQRHKGYFFQAYSNASNYGAGVYMRGAGYNLGELNVWGGLYSFLKSSNPNASSQTFWWTKGWLDANTGSLTCSCHADNGTYHMLHGE